jgi:hypothetical protein
MVLRRSGSDFPLVSLAILLAIIALAARKIAASSIGPAVLLIGILAAMVGITYTHVQKKVRRLGSLRAKYGDELVVQRILRREYWKGQTGEQLCDSLGPPDSVEEQMLITRSRQVWRYGSPDVRITLDDGVVVAWGKRD